MYQVIPETRNLSIVALYSVNAQGVARSCDLIDGDIVGWRIDVEFGNPTPIILIPRSGWRYIGYVKETLNGVASRIITEYGHFSTMDDLRSELRGRGVLPPLPDDQPVG
jgi:hypothetical protein